MRSSSETIKSRTNNKKNWKIDCGRLELEMTVTSKGMEDDPKLELQLKRASVI
jgi:hypothetical protein